MTKDEARSEAENVYLGILRPSRRALKDETYFGEIERLSTALSVAYQRGREDMKREAEEELESRRHRKVSYAHAVTDVATLELKALNLAISILRSLQPNKEV